MTGRPSKYRDEFTEQAYKLCLLGATDEDMANFFEVAVSTLNLWKIEHPEFSEALKAGKSEADSVIAASLFHRAKGYSHPEDKIFNDGGEPLVVPTTKHYPPDTTACIFWLKNRRRDDWTDKTVQEHTGSIETTEAPDKRQLGRALLAILGGVAVEQSLDGSED